MNKYSMRNVIEALTSMATLEQNRNDRAPFRVGLKKTWSGVTLLEVHSLRQISYHALENDSQITEKFSSYFSHLHRWPNTYIGLNVTCCLIYSPNVPRYDNLWTVIIAFSGGGQANDTGQDLIICSRRGHDLRAWEVVKFHNLSVA